MTGTAQYTHGQSHVHTFIVLSLFCLFLASPTQATIQIRKGNQLSKFRFAKLDGRFTDEIVGNDIGNWKVEIHSLRPEQVSADLPKKTENEYCSILIFCEPISSEMMVFQGQSNAASEIVLKGDLIRYVSPKRPFSVEVFRGELADCSEYKNSTYLNQLLKRLNAKLDEEAQQAFLKQSISKVVLWAFESEFKMDDMLQTIFDNRNSLEGLLEISPAQFSQEQSDLVLARLVVEIKEMYQEQRKAFVEEVKELTEKDESEYASSLESIDKAVDEHLLGLKDSLKNIEKNKIFKRFVQQSQEVINTFWTESFFTKKKVLFFNHNIFPNPRTFFPDDARVKVDDFLAPYILGIKSEFDNKIDLKLTLDNKLKNVLNTFSLFIDANFQAMAIQQKIDLMSLPTVEAKVKDVFMKFVTQEFRFTDLYGEVIIGVIAGKLKQYLLNWTQTETAAKLNLVESDEVNVEQMEFMYKLYGKSPFKNLKIQTQFIQFFDLGKSNMLI